MNIRRFVAPDMRRAIHQVRSEHGPDAVILSSRSLDGGVEIVAAIDYDASLLEGFGALRETGPEAAGARPEASDLEDATDLAEGAADESAPVRGTAAIETAIAPAAGIETETAIETAIESATRHATETARAASIPTAAARGADSAAAALAAAHADASDLEDAGGRDSGQAEQGAAPQPAADNLAAMHTELKILKGMLREQCRRLRWADMRAFDPERAMLKRRIEELDLAPSLVETLLAEVVHVDRVERAWREVMFGLGRRIRVLRDDPLDQGGVFALIGPTGVGKTTTIAKLAARHCLRYGRDSLALITIDNFRIGAQRQLDAFGAILGVPVRRADSSEALEAALAAADDRRLVLIDTAGMAPRDPRLKGSLEQLECAGELKRYLVLAANMQRPVMTEAVRTFGARGLAGVVLTKLDEAEGLGAALSALIAAGLPAAWISEGQRVPEDLKLARVSYLLKWAAGVQIEPEGASPMSAELRRAHAAA